MERYRIHDDASVYFVTYSVEEWLPIFIGDDPCLILTDSFTHCHNQLGLRINAYVIMPTHLHAIVFHNEYDPRMLSSALNAFRKHTGRALSDYTSARLPAAFSDTLRTAANSDRSRRFWQPSRHPESIASDRFWRQKLDYLHANPCRKGLVQYPEHWRFSSALYYAGGEVDQTDLPISHIDW